MSGEDGVRTKRLHGRLLFEQSNLSRLLGQLVAHGLIDETSCDKDRRAKTLRITTDEARQLLWMWDICGDLFHKHMNGADAA